MKNNSEAANVARAKRNLAESIISSPSGEPKMAHAEEAPTNSAFFKAIFEIQRKTEEGKMDYSLYAERLWHAITDEEPDALRADFRTFQGSLVARLHDIRNPVYEHVLAAMPKLIATYKDSIAHLSLWSQGDVAATGYQSAKIHSSGVIQEFIRAVAHHAPSDARAFLDQKTAYHVADKKIDTLGAFVRDETKGKPQKIVIIEDTFGNFARASTVSGMDVTPIWAIYSREGMREAAEAKSDGKADEFAAKAQTYNAITSFDDLLDTKRFGDIFKNAHVFVDFDGVIGNNIEMRKLQANAMLSAAVDGLSQHWDMDREATKQRILDKFERKG